MKKNATHNLCMQVANLIDTELCGVKTFADLEMKRKELDKRLSDGITAMEQCPEFWSESEIEEVAQYANDFLETRLIARHTEIRTKIRDNWAF